MRSDVELDRVGEEEQKGGSDGTWRVLDMLALMGAISWTL